MWHAIADWLGIRTEKNMKITEEMYWMGRDKEYPPSAEIVSNVRYLLPLVNAMLEEAEADGVDLSRKDQVTGMLVASGYRPPAINDRTSNSAKASTHLTGEGIDIQDTVNQDLARWVLENIEVLNRLGLYAENPRWTFSLAGDNWVHVQCRAPKSGQIIFIPSSAPPRGPEL